MDSQDAVIRKRLEVDERPLKKLAKKLVQLARRQDVPSGDEIDLAADFAQYEHTLRRLTLLTKANGQEVERHAREVQAIQLQHAEAQEELERLKQESRREQEAMDDRASYDAIALDIRESAPRTRKVQATIIAKLEEEVSELETEKKSYSETWQLRKSAFEDILQRLLELQNSISGEKADAELRDAAEDSDEEEGAVTNEPSPTTGTVAQPVISSEVPDVRALNSTSASVEADVMDTT